MLTTLCSVNPPVAILLDIPIYVVNTLSLLYGSSNRSLVVDQEVEAVLNELDVVIVSNNPIFFPPSFCLLYFIIQ